MRLPKRTRGLFLGLVSLVVGPVVALAVTAQATGSPIATMSTTTDVVERTGHSVLSVGQVVAIHASDPAAGSPQAAPLLPSLPTLPVQLPLLAPPTPAPAPATPQPAATAKPAPSTPRPSAGSIQDIILAAAARHGVDGQWMIRIARCESGLNPHAYNATGPWVGLYQFLPSTFSRHGGTDIYDPSQQADITASMLAHGQAHQWPVCSLR